MNHFGCGARREGSWHLGEADVPGWLNAERPSAPGRAPGRWARMSRATRPMVALAGKRDPKRFSNRGRSLEAASDGPQKE